MPFLAIIETVYVLLSGALPSDDLDLGLLLYYAIYKGDLRCPEQSESPLPAAAEQAPTDAGGLGAAVAVRRDGPECCKSEPVTPVGARSTRARRRLLTRSISITQLSKLLLSPVSSCRTPLWSRRKTPRKNRLSTDPPPSTKTTTQDGQVARESREASPSSVVTKESEEMRPWGEDDRGAVPHDQLAIPPKDLDRINAFKAALERDGVHLTTSYFEANFHEPEASILQRFLVARDYHMEKAKHMLVEDIRWRETFEGGGLVRFQDKSLEEVVGMSEEVFEEHYWSQFLCYDEDDNHCPVFYRSLTGMRTWELRNHTTVEKLVKHQLWEFEQQTRYLFRHPPSFPCRKLKVIISIKDMHWPQLTADLLAILAGFSDVSKLHHPERLKQLFIVDAPWAFGAAWSILTPFIPVKTRDKICILNCQQTLAHPQVSRWVEKLAPPSLKKTKSSSTTTTNSISSISSTTTSSSSCSSLPPER